MGDLVRRKAGHVHLETEQASGWASRSVFGRPFQAVVAHTVFRSSPPKAILVMLTMGNFTLRISSPSGE